MKKLLLLVVVILALPLAARERERSTLLTTDGTLYVIDSVPVEIDGSLSGTERLVLHTRRGEESRQEIVPASFADGTHRDAAMAYDNESGTLFVFWVRQATIMHSELLFAFRTADGVWSDAATFGDPFDYREHLRIAITNRVSDSKDDTLSHGTCIHVVWWELDTHTGKEAARYAMLPIDNGVLGETSFLDLGDFVTGDPASTDKQVDLAVLKQPMLFNGGRDDSVLVVFGDETTKRFHEVRVRPIFKISENGRLRVPIGRREGGFDSPNFGVGSNSQIGTIYRDSDNLAFYTQEGNQLRFVVRENGTWSSAKSTTLDAQVTTVDALSAIRKLLNLN